MGFAAECLRLVTFARGLLFPLAATRGWRRPMGSDWALSLVGVEIQVGVGGYPDIFS